VAEILTTRDGQIRRGIGAAYLKDRFRHALLGELD
jgi:hypothetical protein